MNYKVIIDNKNNLGKKLDNKITKWVFDRDYVFIIDSGNDLNRIMQNFKNGAFIISASRNEYSADENIERTKNLENFLKSNKIGYRPCVGGYIETLDNGEKVDVQEISFQIPYDSNKYTKSEFLDLALDLCDKYDQESVLIAIEGINNGNPVWLDKNSNIVGKFKKDIKLASEEDYYTKSTKHNTPSFKFELTDGISKTYNFRDCGYNIESVSKAFKGRLLVHKYPYFDKNYDYDEYKF